MNIGAVIQARTSSTRLPGKILLNLPYNSNITVLEQVIKRVKKSQKVDEIIIATTINKNDNEIERISENTGVRCFRGSENDVLERYYQAANKYDLDIIVRITSDCPCIDWDIVDVCIEVFINGKYDYVSNTLERTYTHGLDVEVVSIKALKNAYKNAKKNEYREHVTPYIIKNNIFKKKNVKMNKELSKPDIRITLDTEEDYALLCAVYDYLYTENNYFKTENIFDLFNDKPWLKLINKKIMQKKILDSIEEEIREAVKLLDLQELTRASDYLKNEYDL